MGYEVHITRENNQAENEISFNEWQEYVNKHSDLIMSDSVEVLNPTNGEKITMKSDGITEWRDEKNKVIT